MSEPFIGEIKPFGFNFAPRGWAQCDGQLLPIAQYQALFSLLGTTYGGDGRVTFGLPDLRGRAALHYGNGPGLTNRPLGQRSGQENVTLNANQIPVHSHTVACKNGAGNSNVAAGNVPAQDAGVQSATYSSEAADGTMDASMIPNSGGGNQSHNNMQPYLVINWCIALQGIFPSRN
jgi:microcystin-dependent protein